ncbi:MAG TPA: baseplate J/gp47 family protein [Solirubrobacteraceae bacterium]|nr:baseplate J/gp47 family protein [Solirubrobacteraceae bacterium]
MSPYISEPVEYDAATIEEEVRAGLTAAVPGLVIASGSLLDVLVRVWSPIVAENRQLLTEQLADIFQYLGEKILRVPRQSATQASGLADFTISHTNGYTIPAGTEISVDKGDGTRVGFATRLQTVIPNGQSTALDVEVLAVEAGAAWTGVSGVALVEQPALNDVSAVTVSPATIGGVDAEDVAAYLDRLAETTPLLAFTLVNSEDFERDARNDPQVDRALVIPGYKADTGTAGVGGHFTVAVEQDGQDPGLAVRDALKARQQAMVPPNVVAWCIAPTFTDIDVVLAGKAVAGYAPAEVEARVEQAILDFLDPARFALPDAGDTPLWLPVSVVRYQDVVTVVNSVVGFSHYTSLTVNGGTADVTLTGVAPLPGPRASLSAAATITA